MGGELGVSVAPADGLTVRSTWYDNRVKNPVANVTVTGDGRSAVHRARCQAHCQQRQNLGPHADLGLAERRRYRIGDAWRAGGAAICSTRRR